MAFICNDCGNKSTKKFPAGKCPACDSFNIKSTQISTKQAIKEKEPKTLIELVIMALLWGLLAYGVWDKYIKKEDTTPPKASVSQKPAQNDVMTEY